MVRVVPEPAAEARTGPQGGQRRPGRGDDGRRRRRREHVGAAGVPPQLELGMVARAEAADRSEALAERPDDEVDGVLDPRLLGEAPAVLAQDAERGGLVDEQGGAAGAGEGGDL